MALAFNALGNNLLPIFILIQKKYKDLFCIGMADQTGWVSRDEFLWFVKHASSFKAFKRTSYPHWWINHLLIFPNCSDILQPMDRTVLVH
jgi:hypothetical protein